MSVSCSQTGPLKIVEPIVQGLEGEEVFRQKRDLLFKNVHVRRIYDEKNGVLIYIAYSSRWNQDMHEPNAR